MSDDQGTNFARSKERVKAGIKHNYNLAKDVDWIAVSGGIVVIISALIMYNQTTHTIPQTSTTYTVRPVSDLALLRGFKSADLFKSRVVFESSTLFQTSRMQAFAAVKYTLGCYGRDDFTLSEVAGIAWAQLSARELQAGSSPVSVCTCVDKHVSLAFGSTLFLGSTLDSMTDVAVASANSTPVFAGYPLQSMRGGQDLLPRMSGNLPVRLTDDAQFEKLADIRDWCAQAAAPTYTLHLASVWNSRLVLLLGVSLMLIGLDLFSTRRLTHGNEYIIKWSLVWIVDFVPFFFFLVRLLMEGADTHLMVDKSSSLSSRCGRTGIGRAGASTTASGSAFSWTSRCSSAWASSASPSRCRTTSTTSSSNSPPCCCSSREGSSSTSAIWSRSCTTLCVRASSPSC